MKTKKTIRFTNLGLLIGMLLGVCLGCVAGKMLFGNMAVGLCIGVSLGVCIGVSIGAAKDKNVKKQLNENGYRVKEIREVDSQNSIVSIEDKAGKVRSVLVTSEVMDKEKIKVGDIVFADESGTLHE